MRHPCRRRCRAAALPQPVRPTFYVTINQLNLRACPGLDSPKISALELNAEVEKMGEIENWTQIRVKQDGTIGYVSSRYLSPQPVKVAQPIKKKPKKTKPRKAAPPPEAAGEEEEAEPKKRSLSLQSPGSCRSGQESRAWIYKINYFLIRVAIKWVLFVILSEAKNLSFKPPRFATRLRFVQNDIDTIVFDCNFVLQAGMLFCRPTAGRAGG